MSINPDSPTSPDREQNPGRAMACVGCLAAAVLAGLASILLFAIVSRNGNIPQPFQQWTERQACMERMILLTEALKRYHIRNDEYPPTLMDLHPEFLADSRTARCPLDTAPPRKTSYEYIRPKPDAPSDTVVIRCRLHASLAEGESSIVEVTLAGNVGTRSIPTPEVTKT